MVISINHSDLVFLRFACISHSSERRLLGSANFMIKCSGIFKDKERKKLKCTCSCQSDPTCVESHCSKAQNILGKSSPPEVRMFCVNWRKDRKLSSVPKSARPHSPCSTFTPERVTGGSWTRSQLPLRVRQCPPWTICQPIARPTTQEKYTLNHTIPSNS